MGCGKAVVQALQAPVLMRERGCKRCGLLIDALRDVAFTTILWASGGVSSGSLSSSER
jgi:hypothetical protein